jgi:TonB family protein
MRHCLVIALFSISFGGALTGADDKPKAASQGYRTTIYGKNALALAAPRPTKLPEARRLHLAGTGVFVVEVDTPSGKVTAVKVQQSTGERLLDASAIQALQRWCFKPQTVVRVKVPITFTANSDAAQF